MRKVCLFLAIVVVAAGIASRRADRGGRDRRHRYGRRRNVEPIETPSEPALVA